MNDGAKIRVGFLVTLFAVMIWLLWPRDENRRLIARRRPVQLPRLAGSNWNLAGFNIPALNFGFGDLYSKGCGCHSCGKNRSVKIGGFDAADMGRLVDYRPAGDAYNVTRVTQPARPPYRAGNIMTVGSYV